MIACICFIVILKDPMCQCTGFDEYAAQVIHTIDCQIAANAMSDSGMPWYAPTLCYRGRNVNGVSGS